MSVVIGGTYEHYKGNRYKVIGVAKHSETQEKMVVYQALYGEGSLWVRPYDMFVEKIEKNGKIIDRFRCVSEKLTSSYKVYLELPEDINGALLENDIDLASEIEKQVKGTRTSYEMMEGNTSEKDMCLVVCAVGASVTAVLFAVSNLVKTVMNRPRYITFSQKDENDNIISQETTLLQPNEPTQKHNIDFEIGTTGFIFRFGTESGELKKES